MNRRQLLGLLAASPLAPVVAKQLKQQPLPENATQTVITNHMDFRGTLTADQIRDLVSRHAEQVKRDICDAFRRADGGPMPAASYYLCRGAVARIHPTARVGVKAAGHAAIANTPDVHEMLRLHMWLSETSAKIVRLTRRDNGEV
jgi:hypothetical protein